MEPDSTELTDKLREELKAGLQILFKIKNNRVDYSITNRPEPTMSGVTDHLLATAIVYAGRKFKFKRTKEWKKFSATSKKTERVVRDDGRTVDYDESIDIDWEKGSLISSRGHDLTFRVLSIVVQNLMRTESPHVKQAPGPKSN
jgi:hypothetical protein